MNASLLASLLALSAALTWGTGDFAGGLASRRIGAFKTLQVSYIFGLAGLLALALIQAEPLSSRQDLLWGAVSALAGLTGFLFMLHGFTVGRMGVVAPVSAVLGAAIPVAFAALTQGLPSGQQLLGFAIALGSIWLISRRDENEERPAGLVPALLAGVGFAGFFILLDQISAEAVFWPLVANRVTALTLMLIYALSRRQRIIPESAPFHLLIPAGLLDAIANFFFLRAVQTGRLDITSVLVSLYPAITVLWARLVLDERLDRWQLVGLITAVLAVVLITV